MDNKIILELVAKNLEEIKLLVEALRNGEKADPLLIEITATKAKTLYQELMLLSPVEPEGAEIEQVIACEEPLVEEGDFEATPPAETVVENEVVPSPEIESNTIEILETVIIEPETVINEPLLSEEPDQEILESEQLDGEPEISNLQPSEELIVADEIEPESSHSQETVEGDEIEKTRAETHEKKIIGEQFIKEPSVYEKLSASSSHESKVKGMPVTNIMNAIGINDRFLYTRELFGNDSKGFEETINKLDGLNNFIEAIDLLEANFKWTKNETSLKFMELVKRRFEK